MLLTYHLSWNDRHEWDTCSECVGTGGSHGMISSLAMDSSTISQQPATKHAGYQLYTGPMYMQHTFD